MNDIRERLQEVAAAVEIRLPPNTGFIVLAFDFGPGGRLEDRSNANRDNVIKAMKEFIANTEAARWMKHCDESPAAPGEPT